MKSVHLSCKPKKLILNTYYLMLGITYHSCPFAMIWFLCPISQGLERVTLNYNFLEGQQHILIGHVQPPATNMAYPFGISFVVYRFKACSFKAQYLSKLGLKDMPMNLKFYAVLISNFKCAWSCIPPIPKLQVVIMLCECLQQHQLKKKSYKWLEEYATHGWEPPLRHLS